LAEGREEGRTEIQINVIRKLLLLTDFSDVRIADTVGVSEQFVEEIREGKRK